ncbi:MAG: hypothetical protein Tsb0020_03610 [Haliangiales bacterium]
MTEPLLIWIADDDAAMCQMLSVSLQRKGFKVCEYASGTDLIKQLTETAGNGSAPDLIVSDVQMPGANGLDVLHWTRRTTPDTPVILITAFGDRHIHKRAHELGAAMIIDKPFDLKILHSKVTEILAPPRALMS